MLGCLSITLIGSNDDTDDQVAEIMPCLSCVFVWYANAVNGLWQ